MEAAAENKVYELDEFVVRDQFLFSDQVNALKTPTPVIDVVALDYNWSILNQKCSILTENGRFRL